MCRCYSLAHSYREHYHPSAPVFSFCIISIIKQIASFPPRSLLNNLSIIMMISNVSASNVFFCFLSHISSFIIYCYHKCHVSRVKIKKNFFRDINREGLRWNNVFYTLITLFPPPLLSSFLFPFVLPLTWYHLLSFHSNMTSFSLCGTNVVFHRYE